MLPLPKPEDYNVSPTNGFLPSKAPLESLPNPYYHQWEYIMKNLQGLILSKRLHEVVDDLPVLSTEHLADDAEWHRAYSVLAFIAHAYIWGGNKPKERVPPSITIPFLAACKRLQLPPVATYAGLVLWNWKPIFHSEPSDTLANLDTIDTFTGSMDEKWFYLISIAIEARAGPVVPLMLRAMEAAEENDKAAVTECLRSFAERLDGLIAMLARMHDNCDPHVFYNRIRPFLAGSKNMAEAGLPNGVIFDDGGPVNKQRYVQFSGGSNAQSSIIQFFDIVLDVRHRPTGAKKAPDSPPDSKKSKAPDSNFIHEMRKYMPGPHARFLEQVSRVANIRAFVEQHYYDRALTLAFDACLAMLSTFRDKHIQIVSRYIIVQSAAAKKRESEQKPSGEQSKKVNLAHRSKPVSTDGKNEGKEDLTGTGGTSLIPFLRQARDETAEPAIDTWTRRLLSKKSGAVHGFEGDVKQGLAGVWKVEDGGGLCLV
ncbi:Indoleamine 2,3-dioxygenase [Lecanosticta acicola]|uniref:Indoleamine 2,3-dioxygenase n=1 Tax=Lecanosticta acicola TaxID=111012 RepID=A0AAI8Z3Y1_9PEZI|nr:Indoleamine 2,3-dioxygenase [Lecanosticta acicola]